MLLMCVLFWADVTASKEDLSRTLLLNRSQSCTDEEINKMQAIEMSKTSDALMVEFGFDLAHLAKASNHYKLEENEELKSFRKIVVA